MVGGVWCVVGCGVIAGSGVVAGGDEGWLV